MLWGRQLMTPTWVLPWTTPMSHILKKVCLKGSQCLIVHDETLRERQQNAAYKVLSVSNKLKKNTKWYQGSWQIKTFLTRTRKSQTEGTEVSRNQRQTDQSQDDTSTFPPPYETTNLLSVTNTETWSFLTVYSQFFQLQKNRGNQQASVFSSSLGFQ